MSKCYNIPKATNSRHGKLRLKHICAGTLADEMDFDATQGDLFIEIIHAKSLENVADSILIKKVEALEKEVSELKQAKLVITQIDN